MFDVARHRTALSRTELSRPVRVALEDRVIDNGTTITDFGCGLGGDIARLISQGFDCVGWDPNHRPGGQRRRSEVVNLGYVVNVIENPLERLEALKSAWQLTTKVLVVAARLKTDLGGSNEPGTAFADGRLTKLQTFQKFYEQHELRKWIDDALNVVSVAAAPGIFYVFRTAAAREAFLAGRTRRVLSVPKLSTREVILNQHRELFEALGKFLTERGRMPGPDELSEHDALIAAAGSINRAFRILETASDIGAWAVVKELRKQDLLIYLALARFDRRPNFTDLSTSMQRDVRAFCGSYSGACKLADELLFSLGAPGNIDSSIRASTVGKLMPIALYIHVSALAELPVPLRIFEGCARMYYGSIPGANVLKFNRTEPKITYLIYPDF